MRGGFAPGSIFVFLPRFAALAAVLVLLPLQSVLAQQAPPNGIEATSLPLAAPAGVAYDSAGDLYIASLNQNVIRKVDLKGIITTVAGTGEQGFFGDGGAATSAVLDNPAGIAVDSSGNLYIADTHNNRIREVSAATGIITTIAGTGTAGFSGDGGAATSATLNLPTALALDGAGNLYITDTHNHRIREITGSLSTGYTITTAAGDGEQVFAGDGALATAAGLDSPAGLALDSASNLYIGDTHNQRVRLVTASTGIITTLAGNGTKAFGGDSGAATAASLARPRGLAIDASGKLYIVDSDNNRVRTISSGSIDTLAGTGEEGFSGDTGPGTSAALDTPRSTATFASGTTQAVAFTDSANSRARAASSSGVLNTVAGLGFTVTPTLVLSGTNTIAYGTSAATLTATYSNLSNTGTGTVTLLEGTTTRGTGSLAGNAVTFTLPVLPVGIHSLAASYAGDASDPAAASGLFLVTVTTATVVAAANPVSVAYGLSIPTLTGTLSGVLPAEAANVTAVYTTTAMQGSDAGAYPIAIALTGSDSGNYALSTSTGSGSVAITAAPTSTLLKADTNPGYAGMPIHLTATVSATDTGTVGTPAGAVNFYVAGALSGSSPLVSGIATFTVTPALGMQALSAIYVPATTPVEDWMPSTSNTINEAVTPAPDFTLASTSETQTAYPAASAAFTINVLPNPAPFTGTVTFSVSGLPAGAAATFSPTSVTPGGSAVATTMTVKVPAAAGMLRVGTGVGGSVAFAMLLIPIVSRKRRRMTATLLLCVAAVSAVAVIAGCGGGDGFLGQRPQTYTLTVTGTSTNIANVPLVRTTTVTLVVE